MAVLQDRRYRGWRPLEGDVAAHALSVRKQGLVLHLVQRTHLELGLIMKSRLEIDLT
jgi:hypothetical protein